MVLQALPQQQTLFAGELPVTLLRRDYQIESCQKILSEWELELLRVLCQQPMGAGKSLIIADRAQLKRNPNPLKDQGIQSEIAKHPKKIIARARTLAHQIF